MSTHSKKLPVNQPGRLRIHSSVTAPSVGVLALSALGVTGLAYLLRENDRLTNLMAIPVTLAVVIVAALHLMSRGFVELTAASVTYRPIIRRRTIDLSDVAEVARVVVEYRGLGLHYVVPQALTLIIGPQGRTLVRIADDQFRREDMERLIAELKVPLVDIRQAQDPKAVEDRFPGSMALPSRRPYIFALICACAFLVVVVPMVMFLSDSTAL